ncbi:hypothetical protein ADL12_46075 [Streptomyces regalis]|uniref:Uncharacterized protein n=1 Tax=Streptomyces regalis TaxID=68262 RepID=A0A101J6N0_9ACTN|nr:hypothetical protein ADL12_46075 [Streptomyces regalis]
MSGSGSAYTRSGHREPAAGAIEDSNRLAVLPSSASRLLNGSDVGLNPSPRTSVGHFCRRVANSSASASAADAVDGGAALA